MSDQVSFEKSEGVTFKEVAMSQFKRIVELSNVEFRGGFYQQEVLSNGNIKETYVHDSRETYCNAVMSLALVLKPEFDNRMKEKYTQFSDILKRISKKFIEDSKAEETIILGESFYIEDEDKILLETFKQKKLIVHQKLFVSLSELLARKNYLNTVGGTM